MHPFEDTKYYSIPLLAILIDAFGTDVLNWSSETIRLEVKDTYKVEISDISMGKIMSASLILTTDGFYKNLNQFISTCNALSGASITTNVYDPATIEECAWGVTESYMLNPAPDLWSRDIATYIGVRLEYEGWGRPPKILKMATMPHGEATANDFTNNQALFAGVWGAIRENERLLDEVLNINKQELMNQLSSLRLKNGSFDNLVEALKQKTI